MTSDRLIEHEKIPHIAKENVNVPTYMERLQRSAVLRRQFPYVEEFGLVCDNGIPKELIVRYRMDTLKKAMKENKDIQIGADKVGMEVIPIVGAEQPLIATLSSVSSDEDKNIRPPQKVIYQKKINSTENIKAFIIRQ